MPSWSTDTDTIARSSASCTRRRWDLCCKGGRCGDPQVSNRARNCGRHISHRCPHYQINGSALHWLPRVESPNHKTQSSWCSGWEACRRNARWVASHEPGFVFIGFRQSHVEPSNMWTSSNTVHRHLQGIQPERSPNHAPEQQELVAHVFVVRCHVDTFPRRTVTACG